MKPGKFFTAFIRPHRRLTLAAASVAAAAAGSIVALVFAIPGGDSDRAWPASGGEEVLTDAASGDLELTSIAASAFRPPSKRGYGQRSSRMDQRLRSQGRASNSTLHCPTRNC